MYIVGQPRGTNADKLKTVMRELFTDEVLKEIGGTNPYHKFTKRTT